MGIEGRFRTFKPKKSISLFSPSNLSYKTILNMNRPNLFIMNVPKFVTVEIYENFNIYRISFCASKIVFICLMYKCKLMYQFKIVFPEREREVLINNMGSLTKSSNLFNNCKILLSVFGFEKSCQDNNLVSAFKLGICLCDGLLHCEMFGWSRA